MDVLGYETLLPAKDMAVSSANETTRVLKSALVGYTVPVLEEGKKADSDDFGDFIELSKPGFDFG